MSSEENKEDKSKGFREQFSDWNIPVIDGAMAVTGGVFIDIETDILMSLISSGFFSTDSLAIIDTEDVTDEDIEFTKHLDGVDLSHWVGIPKYFNFYVRQSITSTWFRCENPLGQKYIDEQLMIFESEYDESYEDYDPESRNLYEELDIEQITEFAVSIANDSAFGSLGNSTQRLEYTREIMSSKCDKEINYEDLLKVSELTYSYRELAILPDACKELKKQGSSNKSISESLGITPYKVSKYLTIDTPEHVKLALKKQGIV